MNPDTELVLVEMSQSEKALWERAAGPMNLLDWIRRACNRQAQNDVELAESLYKALCDGDRA